MDGNPGLLCVAGAQYESEPLGSSPSAIKNNLVGPTGVRGTAADGYTWMYTLDFHA